jgi:hypothetical protein
VFGGSSAELGALQEQHDRGDHTLAHQLWKSGLHDVRVLATQLADQAPAALKVARAIGKAEVDHGATACKTPDAVESIAKQRARRAKTRGAEHAGTPHGRESR